MTWNRKVVWAEGAFLRPQHFQQQERWVNSLVQGRTLAAEPFYWGFSALEIDAGMLAIGKIGLVSARGIFPDGTPFNLPLDDDAPLVLDIGTEAKDAVVHLALAARRRTGAETALSKRDDLSTRYVSEVAEVADVNDIGAQPADVQLSKMRLSLRLAADITQGWVSLPVALVIERRVDGEVKIDAGFIPTVLNNAEISPLWSFCQELHGMLRQRSLALQSRLVQPGRGGVGEVGDFLLLQLLNRWEPAVEHWTRTRSIHPERMFYEMLKLTGELATFNSEQRRPDALPAYDHDNLRLCFPPLVMALRRSLSTVLEQNAIQIELQERQYGIRVALIPSTELLTTCDFVLAVFANISIEVVRTGFPTQIKLGPVERIRDLVNLHLPGVTLRPLPIAPREIPYHAGYSYFEMDTSHDLWKQLQNSGGLAMHIAGEFPGLMLECWAIRR